MGCYRSCLIVDRKGRLFDLLSNCFVDHEDVPTLPLSVVEMMEKLSKNKKKKKKKRRKK